MLPGFIWRCRQKLGFCFHGDLELQFYEAANCCCVSPACSRRMVGWKEEKRQVTVSPSWEKLWNYSRDAWMGFLAVLT